MDGLHVVRWFERSPERPPHAKSELQGSTGPCGHECRLPQRPAIVTECDVLVAGLGVCMQVAVAGLAAPFMISRHGAVGDARGREVSSILHRLQARENIIVER